MTTRRKLFGLLAAMPLLGASKSKAISLPIKWVGPPGDNVRWELVEVNGRHRHYRAPGRDLYTYDFAPW